MQIPSSEPDYRMVLTGEHSELRAALDSLQETPSFAQLPVEGQYALLLVLDELAANVIEHGSRVGESCTMTLSYWLGNGELRILFEDDGLPFDPATAPQPDLDADLDSRSSGGLGLHLLKNYLDETETACSEGKNQFFCLKKLNETAPSRRQTS